MYGSYENPDGAKGAGGTVRNGRKGAPWFTLNPGESRVLAHAENTSGIIRRMWITISDQTPETLRGIKLEMFWDNSEKPAVSVPFGDFFQSCPVFFFASSGFITFSDFHKLSLLFDA